MKKILLVIQTILAGYIVLEPSSVFADSATLEKGSYTIRPIRVLEIVSEEPIVLRADSIVAADSISINSKIVTNGFQLRLDARTITWGPSGEIVAFTEAPSKPATPAQAPRGPDGVPYPQSLGSSPSIRDGKQGPPGTTGNPGINGNQSPQPIILVAVNSIGELRVDARGQTGGKGGDGGMGGNGGNGVRGRDARCSCGTAGASCFSSSGPGSNGGTSGNGGEGGKGGPAGTGGNAVPLILAIAGIDAALETAVIQLGPGSAGERGDPGKPGKPGDVGKAGRPDGCCADISLFGLICEDASGAGGGQATSHPNPGHLGMGDTSRAGNDVDLSAGPIVDYAYGTPLKSTSDVVNGYGVSLAQISDQQSLVYRDLTSFNVSRTFAYLLRRSIAIAKSSQLTSSSNAVIPQVIADLWRTQFVEPLQGSLDTGNSLDPDQTRFWLVQGQQVVRLFLNYENSESQAALDSKFLDVANRVDVEAQSVLQSCAIYTSILAENTDKLLISHQVSIPACYQVAELDGIQLIVAPLEVREQLPPLPNEFEKFKVNENDIEIVEIGYEPRLFWDILNLFVGTANAQSINVEIDEEMEIIDLIDPRDVRFGLSAKIESRFVVEALSFDESKPYSLNQLGIDLLILGSVAR